ncbi:hypothetical protein PBI_GRAYSON_239 [Rhodococcus phage Grayson]|nr:hypothetical protein PBI_GRAYSON_239 [Rhodococcus phage Grayson]
MSDYYKDMMNYMYSPPKKKGIYVSEPQMKDVREEYEEKVKRIYPEMTTEEVMYRVDRFMKEYNIILSINWRDLFYKPFKIHPETLKRCTRSIDDAY